MKVLHSSCFLEYDYGGAEQVTRRLLSLIGQEDGSAAVCLSGGSNKCDYATVYRVPSPSAEQSGFAQLYKRYALFLQNQWQHRRWLNQISQLVDIRSFDLLHCHDTHWLGVFGPLAKMLQKPLLMTCHQNLPFRLILSPAMKLVEKVINANLWRRDAHLKTNLRHARMIVTPSQFCAEAMVRFLAGRSPPVSVIPNWIDDYLLASVLAPQAAKKGSIVYIGRLAEEKGVKLLLEVADRIGEARFTIVGSNGPLEKAVRRHSRVQWIRSIPHREIVSFIQQHEVAICPSLVDESFGRTALEYRLAGMKIVATKSGGVPEILKDYPNVFWTKKTADDLERETRRALGTDLAREDDDSRRTLMSRFDASVAVNAYRILYASLGSPRA